jgi:hypothetical protein
MEKSMEEEVRRVNEDLSRMREQNRELERMMGGYPDYEAQV